MATNTATERLNTIIGTSNAAPKTTQNTSVNPTVVAASPSATTNRAQTAQQRINTTTGNKVTTKSAATNNSNVQQRIANYSNYAPSNNLAEIQRIRELVSNNFQPTTATEEAAAVAKNALTADTAKAVQQYLNDYNTSREQKIRDMYAQNLERARAQQQTALDASAANLRNAYQNNVNAMRNAYEQNMSDALAARGEISPRYQESMNALSAEYERQRRNNNMQAAVNGLNTGAGSQMALGQSVAYQGNQGSLARSENEALNEADRGIGDLSRDYNNRSRDLSMQYENNLADIKTNYQNKIAEAAANNDYQQAAALLDEYGAQYDRTMNQAKQLAEYGDFSMYAEIYGMEAAQQMEKNWTMQNPDLAYNLGKMTSDEYFKITGKYPNGVLGSYGGSYSSYSGGGGGYSASRDRAYRGPSGHYENGVWTLDSATGSNGGTGTTSSSASAYDYGAVPEDTNSAYWNTLRDR